MDRTIRIVTYSTIAIVFILPIILFIRSGWDAALFLLYYILGVTGCMIVFKVLSLYLPAVWAFIIIGGCFIIAMHMIIQSWVFTVLVTLLVAGLIFVYFMGWHKMLTYIFVGGIIALLTYAIEFDGFHEVPDVSESALQQSESEMSQYDDMTEVAIGLDEDTLFCHMKVNGDVSKNDQKALGVACAESISRHVGEDQQVKGPDDDHLGELYDDYKLSISVKEEGRNAFLQGSKGVGAEGISWYLYE